MSQIRQFLGFLGENVKFVFLHVNRFTKLKCRILDVWSNVLMSLICKDKRSRLHCVHFVRLRGSNGYHRHIKGYEYRNHFSMIGHGIGVWL